jgi:hypothetical protein
LSKRQDSWWNHRPSMYLPRKIEEPWARCTREQLPPNHVVLVLAKVTMVRSIEYSFPDQPNNLRWNLKLVMGLQFLPRHFYKHVTCSSLAVQILKRHIWLFKWREQITSHKTNSKLDLWKDVWNLTGGHEFHNLAIQ